MGASNSESEEDRSFTIATIDRYIATYEKRWAKSKKEYGNWLSCAPNHLRLKEEYAVSSMLHLRECTQIIVDLGSIMRDHFGLPIPKRKEGGIRRTFKMFGEGENPILKDVELAEYILNAPLYRNLVSHRPNSLYKPDNPSQADKLFLQIMGGKYALLEKFLDEIKLIAIKESVAINLRHHPCFPFA